MPFDLDAPVPEPEEVDLAGVAATVRPLTGQLACRADAEVNAALGDLRGGGTAAARFGLDAGALADPNARSGLQEFARAVVLGSLCIATWTVTRAAQPVEVTEANVAAVFNRSPEAMRAFLEHLYDAARRRAEAGELFAASLSTRSAEAATTAEDVTSSPAPAAGDCPVSQAATAQPSSTPPATRKRSPRGGRSSGTPAT